MSRADSVQIDTNTKNGFSICKVVRMSEAFLKFSTVAEKIQLNGKKRNSKNNSNRTNNTQHKNQPIFHLDNLSPPASTPYYISSQNCFTLDV